jgi:ubiquinone/menaquinone biosynthesis C-methylase UbiE
MSTETKGKILAAYETLADPYNALIDHKAHNAYLDRPNTLRLLGDVQGKKVLDAACGPGKYAEILVEKGAQVIGFDQSPRMVELAQARQLPGAEFRVHELEKPFDFLADASLDVVLCALALDYVQDWAPTLKEFYRVLKPGGTLVISCEHPFDKYNYFKSQDYFKTEALSSTWKGFGIPVEVPTYRRSMQDMLMPLIQAGFVLEELREYQPVEEFKAHDPKGYYEKLMRFPGFMGARLGVGVKV